MKQVFIISLKQALNRKEHIRKQFKSINVNYEFFEGVNGRKTDHKLFEKYNKRKLKLTRAKALGLGELGCFASHYLLWEKCVELGHPILILEDDVIINEEIFNDFYQNIDKLSQQYECIRLFQNNSKRHRYINVEKFGNHNIAKFTKGHKSAIGYYLTPTGAAKFLGKAQEWTVAVDIYMDRFWINQVECYGLIPVCITHNYQLESQIALDRAKRQHGAYAKIRRELFSLSESIRRCLWNLHFRIVFFK